MYRTKYTNTELHKFKSLQVTKYEVPWVPIRQVNIFIRLNKFTDVYK